MSNASDCSVIQTHCPRNWQNLFNNIRNNDNHIRAPFMRTYLHRFVPEEVRTYDNNRFITYRVATQFVAWKRILTAISAWKWILNYTITIHYVHSFSRTNLLTLWLNEIRRKPQIRYDELLLLCFLNQQYWLITREVLNSSKHVIFIYFFCRLRGLIAYM